MCIFQRIVKQTCGYQSGRMGHINQQYRSNLVGNLTHTCIIPLTTVGRSAADYKFRLMLKGQSFHLVIVHTSCFSVQIITYGFVKQARSVDMTTVRKMPAMVEIQSHKRITGLQNSQQYSGIGLRTGMRLHVGKLCIKQFLDTIPGKVFDLVNDLTSPVIALSGKPFGIFVGKTRPHGSHYFVTNKVFRCNQLHSLQLALMLSFNKVENLLIFFHCKMLFCS